MKPKGYFSLIPSTQQSVERDATGCHHWNKTLNRTTKCRLVDSIILPIFAGYPAIPLLVDVCSSRLTFEVLAFPMVVSNDDFSAIESLP